MRSAGRLGVAGLLLDTHAWAWSINRDRRLSVGAAAAIERSQAVFVSPVSFYEIGQKVRLGKWLKMAPLVPRLESLLAEQTGRIALLSTEIALLAAALDWPHRDPFDRILAASAIQGRLLLVSADSAFDGLGDRSDWLGRIW